MNNRIDPQKLTAFIGKDNAQKLEKAINTGDTSALTSALGKDEREFLNKLLNDKTARNNFLSSPEAIKLLSRLTDGNRR